MKEIRTGKSKAGDCLKLALQPRGILKSSVNILSSSSASKKAKVVSATKNRSKENNTPAKVLEVSEQLKLTLGQYRVSNDFVFVLAGKGSVGLQLGSHSPKAALRRHGQAQRGEQEVPERPGEGQEQERRPHPSYYRPKGPSRGRCCRIPRKEGSRRTGGIRGARRAEQEPWKGRRQPERRRRWRW